MEPTNNYKEELKEWRNKAKDFSWEKFDMDKFFRDADKIGKILKNREKKEHDRQCCYFSK